jgi:hypothetical protein
MTATQYMLMNEWMNEWRVTKYLAVEKRGVNVLCFRGCLYQITNVTIVLDSKLGILYDFYS